MMFKIGDFSKLCRIPVSALRYYADIGLLESAEISSETGYRYYSLDQLPQLNRILALKDLGLILEQIKDLLSNELPLSEMQGMLKSNWHFPLGKKHMSQFHYRTSVFYVCGH